MAHLHLHTNYSVIDGKGKIEDYVRLAQKYEQTAIAVTDHGTLGGIITAYNACKAAGIKLVAGMELYVDVSELRERDFPRHLTVLARDEQGYRDLITANNLAHRQYYYRPRITLQQILELGLAKNWIILSGCLSSPLWDYPQAEAKHIVEMLAASSGGFYLESMYHESSDPEYCRKRDEYIARIKDLHTSTGLPVVLTNDCHFSEKHHEDIHLKLMQDSKEPEGLEFDGNGFYFKSNEEMKAISRYVWQSEEPWENSDKIAAMTDLHIPEADKVNWYVPDITGGNPREKMVEICEGALKGRSQEYWDRYQHELSVLSTSPAILNSYLVTYDLVQWCRGRDIPVAARGSMAGSLCSYLLGITLEDPIKYNLSFSRAVNPARPTIPDFDLDVSSIHLADILQHLKDKFKENIAISAYTRYGPKGALRKIIKMEANLDFLQMMSLTRTLPEDWPDKFRLEWNSDIEHYELPPEKWKEKQVREYNAKTKKGVPVGPDWIKGIPEDYWDPLCPYEGLYATMSVHPSGILVGGPERELEHEVPLQWVASSKTLCSAYDMYTLKKLGLFKLDVLGLQTLDHLFYMEKITGLTVPNDDYNDPEVLAAFGQDKLAEIFQMDGNACRKVLKQISGVRTFEDIVAANTLARPGAAEFTKFYRTGYEGLVHEYPTLVDILGTTNGLILYQEQVMEIARVLADFDDAEQDDVKESIKYFDHTNWENKIVPKFSERCAAKGIDSTHILKAIANMASYTYNRAHAMTYAAIAYKMMWYKVYHPAAFYAAVYDSSGEKHRLVLESHQFSNIKWTLPDINTSEFDTVVRGNEITFGLGAIKGVGPGAFEAIKLQRPYTSLEDLLKRVERRRCNKRVIEALLKAGALTNVGGIGSEKDFEEFFGYPHQFFDRDLSDYFKSLDDAYHRAGFVTSVRQFLTSKGQEMGSVTLMSSSGMHDCVIFPDAWVKAKGKINFADTIRFTGQGLLQGGFSVESGALV